MAIHMLFDGLGVEKKTSRDLDSFFLILENLQFIHSGPSSGAFSNSPPPKDPYHEVVHIPKITHSLQ